MPEGPLTDENEEVGGHSDDGPQPKALQPGVLKILPHYVIRLRSLQNEQSVPLPAGVQESADNSSAYYLLQAAQSAEGSCSCAGTQRPPSSAAHAAPASRTGGRSQLLPPVPLPSPPGTRPLGGVQHQQPLGLLAAVQRLWPGCPVAALTQTVLVQQHAQPHAGGLTGRRSTQGTQSASPLWTSWHSEHT